MKKLLSLIINRLKISPVFFGGGHCRRLFCCAIALFIALPLTGCGSSQEIFVYNATDYIDGTILRDFEKVTGIKVTYNTYDNATEMYRRFTENPSLYDVIIAPDYMVSRLISESAVTALDKSQISNYSLIDDAYKKLAYDSENRYSVPYMAGTLGIVYDADRVVETPNSWEALWNGVYSQEIIMLDSPRDAVAIGLKASNFSVNSVDKHQIDVAELKLLSQLRHIKWFQTKETKENIAQGRAILAMTRSGEAWSATQKGVANGLLNIKYEIPKEGSVRFVDAMVIPTGAKNVSGAQKFINFLCQTDVALKNTQTLGYTPVQREVKARLPEEMRKNTIIFPTAEQLARCSFLSYDAAAFHEYSKMWQQVRALK
ncbi:MAG: spermidine/putrescine ABC transporter substrate-binding protein [Clostridiales bacterium]|jgi:spermidine/putrescine transport system substrate-binding protein|nr:spermidine/putrescine ABC transporter substrate-binding protein [Clostridiales bacterium]